MIAFKQSNTFQYVIVSSAYVAPFRKKQITQRPWTDGLTDRRTDHLLELLHLDSKSLYNGLLICNYLGEQLEYTRLYSK